MTTGDHDQEDDMPRHQHMPTEQLEASLVALSQLAKGYAKTGPKVCEDQIHETVNEVLTELDRRKNT